MMVASSVTMAETGPDVCGAPGRPWIRLETAAIESEGINFGEILRHVRAELAMRRIDVCTEGSGAPPVASVKITTGAREGVEIAIDVRDAVTDKRLSRTLDLRSLPPDARFLAIAVATDELLRASWIEIALRTAPLEAAPPPPAIMDIVQSDLKAEPRVEMGAQVAFEWYGGGQEHLGVDVRAGVRPVRRLTAFLRLGLRQGFAIAAPDGSVRSSAILAGMGCKLALTPPAGPAGVEILARVDAVRVSFLPAADPGAIEHPNQATAVVAAGGLSGWVALGPAVRLVADATLGAPLRPVQATDTGSQVTAVSGLTFATGGGVVALF
jgi:hypothetical protein